MKHSGHSLQSISRLCKGEKRLEYFFSFLNYYWFKHPEYRLEELPDYINLEKELNKNP